MGGGVVGGVGVAGIGGRSGRHVQVGLVQSDDLVGRILDVDGHVDQMARPRDIGLEDPRWSQRPQWVKLRPRRQWPQELLIDRLTIFLT